MGLPPYGMDCCPCLANEEDYRVYPVSPGFLEMSSSQQHQTTESSDAKSPSFLQLAQPPGAYAGIVDPGGIQGRMAMATQGLPPYGMDCCPCLANEEDYRVYPVQPMFLETASKPTAASPQSAQAMGWPTFPSFLQQDTLLPGTYAGIVDPQNVQSRLAMATQGLPPYGMDCCP